MILRRFSMDKQMGKRPEPLLRSYVESCRRKGFQKHHPTDALAEFAAEWKMPFHQVRETITTRCFGAETFLKIRTFLNRWGWVRGPPNTLVG